MNRNDGGFSKLHPQTHAMIDRCCPLASKSVLFKRFPSRILAGFVYEASIFLTGSEQLSS